MIDQSTIDRIIDTAQIVDVVSDFVSLKRRGANYLGLCPFHSDKTPSFSVSPAKNICKCFSCGQGGNPVHFVMAHEQLSFFDALRYLAKKYGIEIQEKELSDEERKAQGERESMLVVNAFAQEVFTQNLLNNPEGRSIGLSYFKERGFRQDIIEKFQLGYSLEQRDHFTAQALAKGYKPEYLTKTGLSAESAGQLFDRFRGRVMFPIHSIAGKVKAFGGRILAKNDKLAKYVNSPESEIYHKSNELYGIYFAKMTIQKHDRCYLVEGYTDVISMHQAGIENVVASSGTALTVGQIRLIRRFTSNITVIYDGDAAGLKASLRGIDLILKEGLNVKVVLLPDGEDPDSFSKQRSSSEFLKYIEQHSVDFIRFKTSLLMKQADNDPVLRAKLVTEVLKTIALIPDQIIRSIYIKESSQLLDMDEHVLIHELTKVIQEIKVHTQKEKEIQERRQQTEAQIATQATPEQSLASAQQATVPPTAPPEIAMGSPLEQALKLYRPTPLDRYEYAIVRYLVRYGERELNDGESSIRIYDYITQELQEDDIEFYQPLYKALLQEGAQVHNSETFDHHFTQHSERLISKTAIDMVAERYELSKIHTKYASIEREEDRLIELIPRAIYELKDAMIRIEIQKLNEQLKAEGMRMEPTQITSIMQQISGLNELRTALAKELGERIISPFIR